MKKAFFFVFCILFSTASFAQDALTKIKHIEDLKQELFTLRNDEDHLAQRKILRAQIRRETLELENTVFSLDSGKECLSFDLSENSFSISLHFDSEEIFHYESIISNLEAAIAQSAQVSFVVRAKEKAPSEYDIIIFEISVFNLKGQKISQKPIQETKTFAFLPKTDVDWENDETVQKSEVISQEEESEEIDWTLESERTADINFAYNCYWNGKNWHCASLSLSFERTLYDKGLFFGGNFEAGSDNPLIPIVWILSLFLDDDDESDSASTDDSLFSDDYKFFITFTARAGFVFPLSKSGIFRIFAEAGCKNNSGGIGGGSSLIFYKYTSPRGYFALNLEYGIFHTYQAPVSHKANIGIRVAV